MTTYIDTILGAAQQLDAGRGLNYRERLQLERAVFRLTATHAARAFGWPLQSMSMPAREEFAAYCKVSGVGAGDARLVTVDQGFAVMLLIAAIANVDPYVLNENISRIVHRYSTGVATLPSLLRKFAARCQAATIETPSRE